MNILFISRAYPPVKGGIEKQNYEISQALAETCNINLIANRTGKRFLPIFLPYAIITALTIIRKNDVVLLGDGVLAIAGFILKLVSRKPVICIIHGLDLVYRNPGEICERSACHASESISIWYGSCASRRRDRERSQGTRPSRPHCA